MLLQSQRQPIHQRELLFPPRSRSAQGPGHAPTWPARPVHLTDLPLRDTQGSGSRRRSY